MKIERETKIQKGAGILTTSIPAIITEIMDIQPGSKLHWTLTSDNQIIITKEEEQ